MNTGIVSAKADKMKVVYERNSKKLKGSFENHDIDIQKVQQEVAEAGLIQRDLNMSESIEKERTVLRFSVKAPGEFKLDELTKKLMKTGKIIKISISDD